MPLPRFKRLPLDTQLGILETAQVHFAQNGFEAASYNSIIVDSGISKTSFYLYFDGKEDLYQEVLQRIRQDLLNTLGHWQNSESDKDFWKQLKNKSHELVIYLQKRPLDLQLAQQALFESHTEDAKKWMLDMIQNGQKLKIIRTDLDQDLLLLATISVFRAIDKWALKMLTSGKTFKNDSIWSLLQGLWRPL